MKLFRSCMVLSILCLLSFPEVSAQNSFLCVEAQIEVRQGGTTVSCEPGAPNLIRFRTTRVNTPYAFAVTDQDGTILKISVSDKVSFLGLPGGSLRVYAFSFLGIIVADEGGNIFTDDLASICSALSPNYIEVQNIVPEGGTVQSGNGRTMEYICTSDNLPDLLTFDTDADEPSYAYIVTDDQNLVLNASTDGQVDFSNAPAGVCRVWGISYTGALTAQAGTDLMTSALAEGCYDLSDNYVSVIRTEPEGGSISANGGSTEIAACDDPAGNDLTITLENDNDQNFSYAFLLTDETETHFTVINGASITLAELPTGISHIRGISFAGQLAAGSGAIDEIVTDQTGCYDLSDNPVIINRIFVEGGQVALADGSTEARPCGLDELPDLFSFQATTTSQESYAWILTGDDNRILGIFTENQISLDGFTGEDNFRVTGLSYKGTILAVTGQDLTQAVLVDGCFQISENFVTLTRIRPDGGSVSLQGGGTSFSECDSPDATGQTTISLQNTGKSGFDFVYLMTDLDNNVLQVIEDEAIPLSDFPGGHSRIWGLSFEGELTVQAGDNPTLTPPVDGCFDLSDNFITVERIVVDGGLISLQGGGDSAITCGGNGTPDAFTFSSTSIATDQSYALVLTNENNRVFSTTTGDLINFDLFAAGTYRIWGLSYTGNILIGFGDVIGNDPLTDGCFDLSNNFVTIRQEEVNGGQLQFAGGGQEIYTCPGDGNADVVNFENNGKTSDQYTYIITDENNLILEITTVGSFDFDNAPEGSCRIWGLAYSGQLNAAPGEQLDNLVFSDECYSLSSNFLSVVREIPTSGTIALAGGGDMVFTCPGDGQEDLVSLVTTTDYPGAYAFAITDENNTVLNISLSQTINFDQAAPGNCRVWGIAYTGDLTLTAGDLITDAIISDDCWQLTESFVTVVREVPSAGSVSFADGSVVQYTCPGDGNADLLTFVNTSAYPGSYLYLITDENNTILGSTSGDDFDFEGADIGICRVWGVAYTGNITFQTGDNAAEVNLSDDCFDLSSGFIRVIRDMPEAGTISSPGGDVQDFCVGDGLADLVELNIEGASSSKYAFLISYANGELITIISDPEFDFDNSGEDTCLVHGLSYTGEIAIAPGENILEVSLSTDCYDLTDNFIIVKRTSVDGNIISTGNGATEVEYICSGDGEPDVVTFQNGSNNAIAEYRYLITNAENTVIGEVSDNGLDLEGSSFDTLRVWGAAYLGDPIFPIGMDITEAALSDDCFDLSDNFITLISDLPEGGSITTTDGLESILACIGGLNDMVEFANTSTSLSGYTYLVTTPDLVIVDTSVNNIVDFNLLEVGNYLVHGLSYTGQLTFQLGDTLTVAVLSNSCYELSANAVQVERTPPLDGGTVTSVFGDPLFVCLDDGMPDIGAFETTSADPNYRFVITDTLNNILIPDIEGNVVDFDQANPGFCRVYGISFSGNFTATFGTNVLEEPLSDRCSAISSNFVSLVKAEYAGGSVSLEGGGNEISVVVGDGVADVVSFDSTGTSGLEYTYLITDEDNVILGLPGGDSQDFEGAGEGVCLVWGLSYSGEFIAEVGDTAGVAPLSSGCFALSDNFITVTRTGDGEPLIEEEQSNTIANSKDLKLNLFPNPVSVSLHVQVQALFDTVDWQSRVVIEVFDLSGRNMIRQSEELHGQNSSFELDVESLPTGMYLLRVTNGSTRAQKAFFRQ